MKVHLESLRHLHLEAVDELLSLQNTITLMALFGLLDVHGQYSLNDIQFTIFMGHVVDMKSEDIEKYFELLDYDFTGELLFPEFYFFMCCIISVKDGAQKEFLYRHLSDVGSVIDDKCNTYLTIPQLGLMGELLSWDMKTIRRIYECFDREYDVAREKIYLNQMWFLLITLIEDERSLNAHKRIWACHRYHKSVIAALREWILIYFSYDIVPPPQHITKILDKLPPPQVEQSFLHRSKKKRKLWKTILYIILGAFYLTWKLAGQIYKSERVREFLRGILRCLRCQTCKMFKKKCFRSRFTEELVSQFEMDSCLNYGRKRTMGKKSKEFKRLEKLRRKKINKRLAKEKDMHIPSKERFLIIKEKEIEKSAPEQDNTLKKTIRQREKVEGTRTDEKNAANYKRFLRELYVDQHKRQHLNLSKSDPNISHRASAVVWTKNRRNTLKKPS